MAQKYKFRNRVNGRKDRREKTITGGAAYGFPGSYDAVEHRGEHTLLDGPGWVHNGLIERVGR